ncbi:unnamed protein product [Lepeophtheirus salmonis]|uniref:(salmon louse) hypothetical protein n=1 Tax=Lepeophtheirus salmonis TaxID=72036 RepID=A0A7R8CI08_LEPSM|nr:unnamed protein product [Lepeophtheirus salmonis]CAF2773704.1 unnamed protein product [Lepeophtheirus salmonis]
MDKISLLVSLMILYGLGSGLSEMNEIFVNEIPAQLAVHHSGNGHHHRRPSEEEGAFSHDLVGDEEDTFSQKREQEHQAHSQNKHHSPHHASHAHHSHNGKTITEGPKDVQEEEHDRWSAGEKAPPAYGDDTQGVYDLETQPGDEERIFHYDSKKLRPLDEMVKRWKYERQKGQSEGCGYPICVLLDGIPWRFKSLCDFIHHLEISNQDHIRRIFQIQKGDCADAIDGLGWKNPWKEKETSCHTCREDEYCNTKVCWVNDNHSTTYENICSLLSNLSHHTISGWIGIGECEGFFSRGSCINTEWFDIDYPCGVGDVEQARTNILYTQTFTKTGSTRMCSVQNIQGNMDIRTVEGGNVPSDQVIDLVGSSSHSYNGEQIICKNIRQTKKPESPYFWPYDDVKCRDYKVRHCCRNLFGETIQHGYHNHSKPFKVVTPKVKTIFDDCEWRPFLSNSYPKEHEQEDRASLSKTGYKKHVCGPPIFNSMFIDARRRKDDIPFYETGEKLTKVTPTYGLLCSNVNNHYTKQNCSDYKVRFCCVKNAPASWGAWGEWSKCSKSCNSGYRKSKRHCKDNKHKHSCYGKQLRAFRERIETCNELPCAEDAILSEWRSWSPCSTTCGLGERRRTRTCDEGLYKGRSCPEDYNKYFQIEPCPRQLPCPVAIWAKWSFVENGFAGDIVQSQSRVMEEKTAMETKKQTGKCPKLEPCPIHCIWSNWGHWTKCSVTCGPIGYGYRERRRHVAVQANYGGSNCDKGAYLESENCPHCEMQKSKQCIPYCPIDCDWSPWNFMGECLSCYHGDSLPPNSKNYPAKKIRFVKKRAKYNGKECETKGATQEKSVDLDCSQVPKCPEAIGSAVWSQWSQWSYCKGICGGEYIKKRSRDCIPTKKESKCHGKSEDTRKCQANCVELGWTEWEPWSECPVTCGKGKRIRKRECFDPKLVGKEPCKGRSKEKSYCDCGHCNDKGHPIETDGDNFLSYITEKYGQHSNQKKKNEEGNGYTSNSRQNQDQGQEVDVSKGVNDTIKEVHHHDSSDLPNNDHGTHTRKSSDDDDEFNERFSGETPTSVEGNSRSEKDDLTYNDQPVATPRSDIDNPIQEGKPHPSLTNSDKLSASENKFENEEQNANGYGDSLQEESENDAQDGDKDLSFEERSSNEVDISELTKDDQLSQNILSTSENMDEDDDQISKEHNSEEGSVQTNLNTNNSDGDNLRLSTQKLVPVIFNEKSSSREAEEDNDSIMEEEADASYTSDDDVTRLTGVMTTFCTCPMFGTGKNAYNMDVKYKNGKKHLSKIFLRVLHNGEDCHPIPTTYSSSASSSTNSWWVNTQRSSKGVSNYIWFHQKMLRMDTYSHLKDTLKCDCSGNLQDLG